MIKLSAAGSGSFSPTVQLEKREMHMVFLHFSSFYLDQNLSLAALADRISSYTGSGILHKAESDLRSLSSIHGPFIQHNIAMRLMDILMAIPSTLLAIAISAALGSGVVNTMIAVGVGSVPLFARVTRSAVLSVREQEYIESSKAIGAGNMRIIFKHIIPNAFASALVIFTLRLADNVLIVSSLSFLGLGVQPPTPEWGSMISAGRQYIRDFYPIVVCPGLAIMVTLIAFNLLGDGLRDALDPRLKQ